MASRTSGSSRGRKQEVAVPGALHLLLLLVSPFVLYLLRPRPLLLVSAASCYLLVILPRALGHQLPQASPLWLPRSVTALLTRLWVAASLRVWIARAGRWAALLLRYVLWCLLRACVLPSVLLGSLIGVLHRTYLTLHGARITADQMVFFLMVQQLVTPQAYLTALYFLLFYTVLLYIYRALFTRQWARVAQMGHPQDLARLAAWYMAVRLGKGVAMSFVLVMFTLQFSHVEPDLTFIVTTFIYFLVTQHKWSGQERIVEWVRMLQLPILDEAEDFWVPVGALVLPMMASAGLAATLVFIRPWLVVTAAYTNLLVPGVVVAGRVRGWDSLHAVVLTTCRRATAQELEEHPTCPVCLEELQQARVTPCLHLYHSACLSACLMHSTLCPLCKQTIR